MNTTPSSTHLCPIYIHYVLLRRSLISLCLTGIKSVKIYIRPMSNCLKPTSRQLATSIDWHCYCTVYNVVHICGIVCLFLSFWVTVNLYGETFLKWQGYFRCYVNMCIHLSSTRLLPDYVHPVWWWSSCRSSLIRLCSPRLTVEFMSLIFYKILFTPFDGGVHVAHILPNSVPLVWRWSTRLMFDGGVHVAHRSSFTRLCSPSLTVEFMSLIFYQNLFTPFDGEVHVAHLLPDSVHPVWRWSSCRSSFTRLCSPRDGGVHVAHLLPDSVFDGGVHVAHLLPDSVHPVWRWSSCRSSFTRLCSPHLTVEFMSLIFVLLPDSVHPVWRWSSCRSSFTRLCSPRLTVEFMSLIFYQTLFTPFDGGVHVAHLLPDSVHPVWRWSSCRSSFTRLCSPHLTVEFMSLIFYQTLFTPFDGGVHVAHLLPDSVHPVWRWSSCRSSFTRLCSPRLTVEFMSLIFYQTLFTPFDGGVHVAHLLPDSVHPVWRWSSCRSSFLEFMSLTRLCSVWRWSSCRSSFTRLMSLIFYQTLFTPFDGGVHVAHLLPDSVHPVWRWSSCRSSFTRLCSPRLTVEFMSLIFYQTLFTPFDGGVHVAHLLPDSVHPVWRWSSCRSSFTRLCSPRLTVEFMSLIFYQTLFTHLLPVWRWSSCRSSFTRLCSPRLTVEFMSLIFYQTLFTPFDGGVHVAHLLPDSVHPVWRWSSCRSSFTRLCSPRLTVEFMSLIFYQTLFTPFDGGVHVAHLLPDSVHPVWRWSSCRSSFTRLCSPRWSSCRSSFTRLCSPRLTVEFMSLIFYQTLFTPFDGGVHVAHLLPDSVHPVWRWSSCRSSFTRLCSPRLTVEFMSLIFYQTLFTPFDGGVHVAHLLPDSVHPVWRWSSCRSSFTRLCSPQTLFDGGVLSLTFTRLCSPRLTVEFMSLIFYQTLFTPFDGGVHVAHLLPDSVHPVWRWSSCRSSFTRLCSPRLTVEFMSLIFYQTLFTPFDGGVHVAHLLPDSVHPVWRWSSCRSSFTRLCSPRLTVEFMSLIFYQTLFTPFDGGVHVAHLLPDSVHPVWRWSSCRSSFTRLCSPRLTVEFMSLIFYQTLFTPFDGGVHVAHLLPDSVHPVWRWSSCRSSFTRLCSPRLTVEFMSLIFYQTLFTPFDGGVHVAHLLPDSVHPVWRWSSCRSSFTRLCSPRLTVEFMSLIFYQTLFTQFDGGVHVAHLLPDSVHPVTMSLIFYQTLFTQFDGGVHVAHLLPDSVHPVEFMSLIGLCSPRLTVEFMSLIFYQTLFTQFDGGVHVAHLFRLCSPRLTVEFMSLIFYQTLFTPFDGGVHVAHLLPDSVHPVWRWSSSSFTRLCSPRLTVEFMSLIFYQTLFTPVWRWSSCRSSFTRLCSPRLTVEFMSLIFYQTLFTPFDGGVHVAHLLPDSVHPVWRWSSCRSSFTPPRLTVEFMSLIFYQTLFPRLTVEFMSLIFYQTLFTPFDGGVHVAHLFMSLIFYQTLFTQFDGGVHVAHHLFWRWSSRLCSPRLTVEFMSLIFYQTLFTPFDVEFMSLIFYQTLFTQFDGGVHVAHLLPDSVHPVWRWSSCRSSFTRLCSPSLTVEFMSLIFYQTLFTPFDGGVHVAHLLPDSVHPVWRWSSCRSSFTRLCSPRLTVEFMSLIFYQTLFTQFDGGVHVAHLLPDSVHPVWRWSSCLFSSFTMTLFTPFDGGDHVAHLLPDSVHPVWRWSSCRSSFTRLWRFTLCSPSLTVEFMSLIFYQTLFTQFDGGVHVAHLLPDSVHPVWRWSSCRSSFTRLCSPCLTVEFMSLFYQTLFTQFDGGVHVAHLLPDSVHPVWRWSSCRSSFTRLCSPSLTVVHVVAHLLPDSVSCRSSFTLCSPSLTVEFMSLIFYQTLFTQFDGGVHVAHLLPDSVHPVWRWSSCRWSSWSSCRSSFTRLCSPSLTVEFMSLIFYQTLFTQFDGGVHVAHLLPDSVHPVWRWSSCRSSSQFSVCWLILSVDLWVLPFPLEDCSVFGNFVITRIRSLPFFQCFPCLWTVPFCFPKLLIAHSIFWHDIIYYCIASKALKGKFTFIFLFLYVCRYR